MSSHKKEPMKLVEHGLVTGEALLAYLRNELGADEKQEVETLLRNDPFAQDALEGLQSAASKEALADSIISLHKRVHHRLGIKEEKRLAIHWVNYVWVAALLAILLAVGFALIYYFGKNAGRNAGNEKPVEQQINSNSQPPKVLPTPKIAPDTGLYTTPAASDTVKSSAHTVSPALIAPTGGNAVATPVKNSPLNAPSGKQTVTGNTAKPPIGASGPIAPPVATGAPGTAAFSKITIKDAMQQFYSQEYKVAAPMFDDILKREPANADALYFGGISNYINGNMEKSEKNFDVLLKEGTSYIDGSKWYKANILLSKGDITHGKSLLQELANSNSSYKERAIKKLGDLGQ